VLNGPTPADIELATKATYPTICRGRNVYSTNEMDAKYIKHMHNVFRSLFAISYTLSVNKFDTKPIL